MTDEQRLHDPAEDEARIDRSVLNLLIDEDNQRPWSLEEVVREHGNQREALDGIDRLHGAGLVHKTSDGFIFATRAAIRYSQIAG